MARGEELGSMERVGEKMVDISSKMCLLDIRATRAEKEAAEAREGEARALQKIQYARLLAKGALRQSEENRQQAEEMRERNTRSQQQT